MNDLEFEILSTKDVDKLLSFMKDSVFEQDLKKSLFDRQKEVRTLLVTG
jgi:hypothetical protein